MKKNRFRRQSAARPTSDRPQTDLRPTSDRPQTDLRQTTDQRAIGAKNALEGENAMAFRECCYGTMVSDLQVARFVKVKK
jgi:hypothetical protein